MNPLGILQLGLVALEGVAYALNPKLRKQEKGRAWASGLAYIGILLGGLAIIIFTVWSLYFQK
jgi:hypothetical protein